MAEALNGTHWLDADSPGCRAWPGRLPVLRRIGAARRRREREEEGLHVRRRQDQSGPDQIQQRRGDRAPKGANDTWTIVQPAEAPADRNSVSDVVTNLANLEEQRVVDENAADLKALRPRRAAHRRDVPRRGRERAEADPPRREDARQLGHCTPSFRRATACFSSTLDGRDRRQQIDLRFPRQDGARVRSDQGDVARARFCARRRSASRRPATSGSW